MPMRTYLKCHHQIRNEATVCFRCWESFGNGTPGGLDKRSLWFNTLFPTVMALFLTLAYTSPSDRVFYWLIQVSMAGLWVLAALAWVRFMQTLLLRRKLERQPADH